MEVKQGCVHSHEATVRMAEYKHVKEFINAAPNVLFSRYLINSSEIS